MATKLKGRSENSAKQGAANASGPLGRALRILEIAIEAARPLSSAEIAQRCGLDPSTAHRLVQALTGTGHLLRDEATKRYLPSPKLIFPLPLYHSWNLIRRDAAPALAALRDQLGLTTGFVVFYLGQRVLVELAPGRDPLSPDYSTWLSSPLHASGSGKILLLAASPAERKRLLGPPPYEKFTAHTVTDHAALERELEESADRGYVLASDDYIVGFRVVAAPIRMPSGAIVGCFFCSGRSAGFTDRAAPDIGLAVKHAAELFSRTAPSLQTMAELIGGSTLSPTR